MRFLITPALLAVLLAGCASEVTGSGTGASTTETTERTTERTTEQTSEQPTPTVTSTGGVTALNGVPVEHYEAMPAQYCDQPFVGALGKPMLAVVVETPAGRLNCDQAGAVLFDYYAERREPKTGLPPVRIGTMSCNQVAEGMMPQVVCADAENVIYSMWPQT